MRQGALDLVQQRTEIGALLHPAVRRPGYEVVRVGRVGGVDHHWQRWMYLQQLLQGAQAIALGHGQVEFDAAGQPMALTSLGVGATVLLRYQPAARSVQEIRLVASPTQPNPDQGPQILVVGILNDSPILRGGQSVLSLIHI